MIKYGRDLYGQCGGTSEVLGVISILALWRTGLAAEGAEKVENIVLARLMNVVGRPLAEEKDIENRKYLGSFRARS